MKVIAKRSQIIHQKAMGYESNNSHKFSQNSHILSHSAGAMKAIVKNVLILLPQTATTGSHTHASGMESIPQTFHRTGKKE